MPKNQEVGPKPLWIMVKRVGKNLHRTKKHQEKSQKEEDVYNYKD